MILLAAGLALILWGGIAALLLERRPASADRGFTWCVVAGCAIAAVPALSRLAGGAIPPEWLGDGFPGTSRVPFGIDALSAWFLLPVLFVGTASAAYGAPYLRRGHAERALGVPHLLMAALVVGLVGVVTATTIVAFLVAWEVMAIGSYLLIVFERHDAQARRAGFLYIVLTHTCTLALLCLFTAWAGGDVNARFTDLPAPAAAAPVAANLVLTLALVAFGIKAGLVPFHFWLPDAHSAAPSHVSALMSGVVIKMGIYGLMRVLVGIGTPPAWWGWTVLGLGVTSAVFGVLWALAQHDLKRLLAYHSVENIGIILMGLGLGALGSAYHQPALALLGYAGALLHTLNHALFKSLLFLGAGTVNLATGTREIDRMGALARVLPRTATAFLVGSAAIVGLPPFNGFVSEWLVFRGLLGCGTSGSGLKLAIVAVVGLALTGALALACFSKVYGVVFLGNARHEAPPLAPGWERALAAPQVVLAAACFAIGVAPVVLLPALGRAAAPLLPPGVSAAALLVPAHDVLVISWVAAALVGLGLAVTLARAITLRGRAHASAATWGCGYAAPTPRMQYTASSYAAPLLQAFGAGSGSRVECAPGAFRTVPRDLVLDLVGRPLWRRLTRAAEDIRILQSGAIRWYLLYTIVCLLALLVYLRAAGRP